MRHPKYDARFSLLKQRTLIFTPILVSGLFYTMYINAYIPWYVNLIYSVSLGLNGLRMHLTICTDSRLVIRL